MQPNKNDDSNVSKTDNFLNRIKKEFETCTYISDIQINDEEFTLLIALLRDIFEKYYNTKKYVISPFLAVALVQIGLRNYDGSFWIYVENAIAPLDVSIGSILSFLSGDQILSGVHQNWLGRSFYYTLEKYDKYRKNKSEMMNNILLHCFITDHYADDLFDFLFSYYEIDLDRDLSRNNEKMQSYLIQSMKKGENSARAYKIKKHTSDAVIANEDESKKRLNHILHFIDNAFFNDIYPNDSQERIAKLFCDWANDSKKFKNSKKEVKEQNKKRSKSFTSPYIHFNTNSKTFDLILPSQTIQLSDDYEPQQIEWRIYLNIVVTIDVDFNSGVTCCKTEPMIKEIDNNNIFDNIKIELIKDKTQSVREFKLPSNGVRFFDSDWDSINYSYYLPISEAYAFTKPNEVLISESGSALGCERACGLDLYTLELKEGDIWRLPNGKVMAVGRPAEEGIFSSSLVPNAHILRDNNKIPIYSSAPSLFFRMNQAQENGTRIFINGDIHRFDIARCVKTNEQDITNEYGYILQLTDYCNIDGFYRIKIDVPNSKRERYYEIYIIKGFSYIFDDAPYIFKTKGAITLSDNVNIVENENLIKLSDNNFSFEIQAECDYLSLSADIEGKLHIIRIDLPVFKWKFGCLSDKEFSYKYDNNAWEIGIPEEIWYSQSQETNEFPEIIYLKCPADSVEFSIFSYYNKDFTVSFNKNKEHNMFICDTRKMLSWFDSEKPLHSLYINFSSNKFCFCKIVTGCYVRNTKFDIWEDRKNNQLIFECEIGGCYDCEVDIYRENKRIAKEIPVTTGGIKLKTQFISGNYRVDFYQIDDEDDFGFSERKKFDSKIYHYINKYDLTNSYLEIIDINERNDDSIFKGHTYPLKTHLIINDLAITDDNSIYFGKIALNNTNSLDVRVEINYLHKNSEINLKFLDVSENKYKDFLYDKEYKCIITDSNAALSNHQENNRYIRLSDIKFYYGVQIKKHKEGS